MSSAARFILLLFITALVSISCPFHNLDNPMDPKSENYMDVPKIISPEAEAQVNAPAVEITWEEPSGGAAAYTVEVSASEDYSDSVLEEELTDTSVIITERVFPDGVIYYRVKGVAEDGRSGPWAESSFTLTKRVKLAGKGVVESIIPTSDGGYALTGASSETSGDLLAMKLDAAGRIVWEQTYVYDPLDSVNRGKAIIEDSNGNLVIAGFRVDDAGNNWSIIYKLNPSDGSKSRDAVAFGGVGNEQKAFDLIEDSSGKYVYVGQYDDTDAFYLCKLQSSTLYIDGEEQFDPDPSGDFDYDKFTSVLENGAGNYVAVGWGADTTLSSEYNYSLIEIDKDTLGIVDSTKGDGAGEGTIINDVIEVSGSGNYIIAGSRDYGGNNENALLVELDKANLGPLGSQNFEEGDHEEAKAVFRDSDGNFVLAGSTGWDNLDMYAVKTDGSFSKTWALTAGETGADEVASDCILCSDGGYLFACSDLTNDSIWLIKTDPEGN